MQHDLMGSDNHIDIPLIPQQLRAFLVVTMLQSKGRLIIGPLQNQSIRSHTREHFDHATPMLGPHYALEHEDPVSTPVSDVPTQSIVAVRPASRWVRSAHVALYFGPITYHTMTRGSSFMGVALERDNKSEEADEDSECAEDDVDDVV